MTVELRDQLRELCAVIDEEQGSITTDFIEARDDAVMIIDRPTPRTLPVRRRWLVAVAAALAVLVLVGGVALLFNLTGSETPPAKSAQAWSRVPGNEAVFDQGWMSSVTAGGPGLVAVGNAEDHAVAWTSVDGTIWSRVPHDDAVFGGAEMLSVTVGGPGLVAVGWYGTGYVDSWDAAVWTSNDGIAWSRVPHDDSVFGGAEMRSVTVGGPGLVAVGQEGTGYDDATGPGRRDAAVWTSVDGIAWSRVVYDEAVFGGEGEQAMTSVTVGGPGLVAVGWDNSSAAVWTSADGFRWSRVPDDEAVFGRIGRPSMLSVTVGGPGLVAVGSQNSDAAVWTSVDGTTWSRVPHDEAVFGGPNMLRMTGVTVQGPDLVAVGFERWGTTLPQPGGSSTSQDSPALWTSVDGITWSRALDDESIFAVVENQQMLSVTAWESDLVAVGWDSPLPWWDNPAARSAAVWVTKEEG